MPSSKRAHPEDNVYKRGQNAAERRAQDNETTVLRHSTCQANETPLKSHTAQLTLSHHAAGLADGLARPGQGRVFVFASGVMVVEAGGRPQHKKWLMEAQGCAQKHPQLMRIQGCVQIEI